MDLERLKKSLPTPSKHDLEMFESFFIKKCCDSLECTKSIKLLDVLEQFKNFIGLSAAQKNFFIYGELNVFKRPAISYLPVKYRVLQSKYDYD